MNSLNVNRICVIGGSGNGKTVLTNNLGRKLNLPVFHIDSVNFFQNWVERDKAERDKLILDKSNEEKWIIDGTYAKTLIERFDKADLIIFLDYSTCAQLRGVLKRKFKYGNKAREEIEGCEEKIDFKFLKFVLGYRKNKRPAIVELLNNTNTRKLIFKSRRQLNKWYYEEFKEKMQI